MPRPRPVVAEITPMSSGEFLLKVVEGPIFFNVKLRREEAEALIKQGQEALETSK